MFISYAQNFEDVILNRLFSDRSQGFYIDVGAQHPRYDSVTKAFYDRGWQGINIEPVKEYFQLLQQARERDLNLNLAVGESESELEFYELEGTGLSTFDRQTAHEIAQKDGYQISSYQVAVKKLGDICQQHVTQAIDFLKIDVEGWEESVVLGHDWENFRPVVVVLEATLPNSPIRKQTNIAQILESKSYEYVYFDGLNDYYLAQENSNLKHHFETPPNVFDNFISSHTVEAQTHGKNLENVVQAKEKDIQVLNNKYQEQLQLIQQKETEIQILNNKYQEQLQLIQQQETEIQILNNKYRDQFLEIKRLTDNLKQQQKSRNQKSEILMKQINQLQVELSHAQQLVVAMETSKFWKLRSAWFKVKQGKLANLT